MNRDVQVFDEEEDSLPIRPPQPGITATGKVGDDIERSTSSSSKHKKHKHHRHKRHKSREEEKEERKGQPSWRIGASSGSEKRPLTKEEEGWQNWKKGTVSEIEVRGRERGGSHRGQRGSPRGARREDRSYGRDNTRTSPAHRKARQVVSPVRKSASQQPAGVEDVQDSGQKRSKNRSRRDERKKSSDIKERKRGRQREKGTAEEGAEGALSPGGGKGPGKSEEEAGGTPTMDEVEDRAARGSLDGPRVKEEDPSSSSDSSSSSEESSSGSEEEGEESEGEETAGGKKYSKFESSPDEGREDGELEDEPRAKTYLNDTDEGDEPSSPVEVMEEEEDEGESDSPVPEKPTLPTYYPGISGCRSVEEFHCLNRIEEGTYGVVYRAKEKRTDAVVALKRLKMEKEKEGFPITSLREINMLLKAGGHENIVNVREIVVGSNMDKIYLVMDYVEHDMKSLMESMKQPFLVGEVKTLLRQLLAGVHHLHDNWILHRDLKTSNLLLSHKGILKIGDFGLAREYGSPLKPYTPVVVTLWYRAPELLLGVKQYACPIDLWSVGCIFAEFLTLKPLFPGRGEMDAINRIFKMLGTPSEAIWPGYNNLPAVKKMTFADFPYNQLRKHFGATLSDAGFGLLNKFLTYNPAKRITALEARDHDWFNEEPRPVRPEMFPTWPAKSELGRRPVKKVESSPKPPSGGKQFSKELGGEDEGLLKELKLHPTEMSSKGFSLKFDAPKF